MTLLLDDEITRELNEEAQRRGQNVSVLAAELLRQSLKASAKSTENRHAVMEFAGAGAGRPGALGEKDAQAYVNELRDEWSEREQTWQK